MATRDHFRLIFRRRLMGMCNAANIVMGVSKGNIIWGWWDPPDLNTGTDDQTPQRNQAGTHTAICTHRGGAEADPSAQIRRNWSQLSGYMDEHSFLVLFLKPSLKKRVSALFLRKNACHKDEQSICLSALRKSETLILNLLPVHSKLWHGFGEVVSRKLFVCSLWVLTLN